MLVQPNSCTVKIGNKASTTPNKLLTTNTAIKKLQAFHSAFGEDSQIYSQLEEVGEAGLYGSKLKEEVNETLVFLQELRDFKKNSYSHFNKIKSIPKKSRTARDSTKIDSFFDVASSSITYIKSAGHPGVFYKTDEIIYLTEMKQKSITNKLTYIIYQCNPMFLSCYLPQNNKNGI